MMMMMIFVDIIAMVIVSKFNLKTNTNTLIWQVFSNNTPYGFYNPYKTEVDRYLQSK